MSVNPCHRRPPGPGSSSSASQRREPFTRSATMTDDHRCKARGHTEPAKAIVPRKSAQKNRGAPVHPENSRSARAGLHPRRSGRSPRPKATIAQYGRMTTRCGPPADACQRRARRAPCRLPRPAQQMSAVDASSGRAAQTSPQSADQQRGASSGRAIGGRAGSRRLVALQDQSCRHGLRHCPSRSECAGRYHQAPFGSGNHDRRPESPMKFVSESIQS